MVGLGPASGGVHGLSVEPTVQGGFVLKFFGSALKDQASLVNQDDAVRHLRNFLENMG